MFFKKICLDGYIPFTHNNIHHVEIDFDQPCTAIVAANGVGKSSLLRELTVYPACRTDYLKDGYVQKVIEHNGHIYTLTSDFKNATAPHSFKMDDQELNLSGTSDVSRDLVEEHFGINPVIRDLMAGNTNICSMSKAIRKQFFSATYPSDLSFVLEYHKKVCSQIRAYSSQIKLLQSREGSLLTSLIEPNEQQRLSEWRTNALTIIDRIDKINILLENEIQQLSSNDCLKANDPGMTIEELRQTIIDYVHRYQKCLIDWNIGRKLGEDPTIESLTEKIIADRQTLKFLSEKNSTLQSSLVSIRDELDKFIRIKNAPSSDKKDELANELVIIGKEMEDLKVNPDWQNLPSIHQDKLDIVEQLVPELNDLITSLHSYAGKLIDQEGLNRLRSENDTLTFSVSNLMAEKSGIEQQLAQHKSRREMMTQNSYPSDCARVCGLRATLEASVRDIDLRCQEFEARLKKIYDDLRVSNERLSENQKRLMEVGPAIPIMKRLWDKLSENYLLDLALNGESFLECANAHCFEITNRIVKGIASSKIYYRYKELFDKSEQIKSTLAMMETNEAANLSAEVIQEMIEDRQKKLDAGIVELEDLERSLKSLTDDVQVAEEAKFALTYLNNFIKTTETVLNKNLIRCRIDFDRKMIDEHTVLKNQISTRLREIEHTLEEQKRITDVLNTEIRPTLEQLRKDRMDWELVESGLSPTKGLPCIYLVRFMNRLIARANAIIKEIWYCDMELAYVNEQELLDFSIGVIFNKSTTVKDCSLCSNGQKAVINFAFLMAVAIERGYINWCPLSLDEIDGALTEQHRTTLVATINRLLEEGVIKQLFLINHFALQSGISLCSVVALATDGILVPGEFNTHASIT